jgi:hypothetical protein
MMNLYQAERNSEERREAMIAAAASDSPQFWLSRTIARLLVWRRETPLTTSDAPANPYPELPVSLSRS